MERNTLWWLIAILLMTTACATPVTYHNPNTYIQPLAEPVPGEPVAVSVAADREWQDAGIVLITGQRVSLVAEGEWCYGSGTAACRDAMGGAGEGSDPMRLMAEEPVGALLARIGGGHPFVVGRGISFVANREGRLRLAGNDSTGYSARSDNSGSLGVRVTLAEPGDTSRAAARKTIRIEENCVAYLRDGDKGERFANHCPYPVRIRFCVDYADQDHPCDCHSGKSCLLDPLEAGSSVSIRGIGDRAGKLFFRWCQAPGCSDPGDPAP